MNKERLLEIKTKLAELRSEIDASENAEEIKQKGEEIAQLEKEREEIIEEAEKNLEDTDKEVEARAKEMASKQIEDAKNKELEAREKVVLGSFGMKKGKEEENMNDKYSSLEYRQAFMDYVLRGKEIPAELRADATTQTTDIGSVIPTTLMNKIIQDIKSYGHIFSRVTHTNFKGGLEIPTSDSRAVATWTAEGSVSTKQKKEVKGKVSFLYHKLQCRVATTLEASTVSLDVFEAQIVADIKEAMTIALETAIISGTGEGQPTGILNSNITNIVEFTEEEIGSWDKWSKTFAKLPLGKRSNVALIVNSETYEGNLDGAVDKNGQPIARTNYGMDGSVNYRFKGKETILVEGLLPSFDDAEAGEVFGIVGDLKDYYLNSNLQMVMRRYFDEDLDEYVDKATLIADGKVVSTQGFILLKKAGETPSV